VWLRSDGERRKAAAARRLLMEGRDAASKAEERLQGRLEMAEEEMRRGKRAREGKRVEYGGIMEVCLTLALAGRQSTGYKAQLQAFWAQAPLQQAPGRSGPSAAVTSDMDSFFYGVIHGGLRDK
jgi:hypothetical protein